MTYFLDTNLIVYAAGAPHPYKDACASVITRVATGELIAVTNTEVLQELLHIYSRRGDRTRAFAAVSGAMALVSRALPVTDHDIARAMRIMQESPSVAPRDAIHAATALNNNTPHIISADTDLDAITGIMRVDPRDLAV